MTRFLLDMPGNEAPRGAKVSFLVARGGKRLRYVIFDTAVRPRKGAVVVLTGRNECIEKYFETIRALNARGLTAAIMDWRGQGLSDRVLIDPRPGHVDDFDTYVSDLDQFFSDVVLPDCPGPFNLLAHSTGSLVSLAASHRLKNRVRRMVLIAPLLEVEGLPLSLDNVRRTTGLLGRAGFGRRYASGGAWKPVPFERNVLTRDRGRYERNVRLYETYPRLALGGPTISWMNAATRASKRVSNPDFMARMHIPTLFIAAGADTVVSTRAIERYARRPRCGDCLTIDGARHEVLQETDAVIAQFWAAFDAFIPGSETFSG